jgi:hypothetical protein
MWRICVPKGTRGNFARSEFDSAFNLLQTMPHETADMMSQNDVSQSDAEPSKTTAASFCAAEYARAGTG